MPLQHDTPGETAQPGGKVLDWRAGEVEPVQADDAELRDRRTRLPAVADKMAALGPLIESLGHDHQGGHLQPDEEVAHLGREATA